MITTAVATPTDTTRQQPAGRRHAVPMPRTAYAAAAGSPTFDHECHQGFCTVCGSVWPCSRAVKWTARQAPPIVRLDALAT
jgi:hypothetical protein